MTIWVDPAVWPAHGHLWSHVISDVSLGELHAFAQRAGIPSRSFEGDHYDVPEQRLDDVIAAGATATSGRDLARRLAMSGLRFRKRKGERPLGRYADALVAVGGPHTLDIIASPLEPLPTAGAAVVLVSDGAQMVLVRNDSRPGWAPPGGKRDEGETVRQAAVRELAEETGLLFEKSSLSPVGYERITIPAGESRGMWTDGPNYIAVFATPVRAAKTVATQAHDVLEARWFTFAEAAAECGHEPWWLIVQHWLDSRSN
ncbi:MAG: DUF4031 domain-containing protein [Ornithinimicrobium sp.]